MTVGERIRLYRKISGLTQREVAEIIGSHYVTVQQYELNKRQPRIEMLVKLADVFGVTVNDLVYDGPLEARKENGIKQKQIAEKLGVTPQTISCWETRKRNPKPATVKKLRKALDELIAEMEET